MTKRYELKIDEVYEFEGYDLFCYMSKGHHDAEEFADVLKGIFDMEAEPKDVSHSYWRNLPDGSSQWCEKGIGAYPVTTVDGEDVTPIEQRMLF